jgi:hypothetical protein
MGSFRKFPGLMEARRIASRTTFSFKAIGFVAKLLLTLAVKPSARSTHSAVVVPPGIVSPITAKSQSQHAASFLAAFWIE